MEPYTNNHSTLEPEAARFYIARSNLKVKTQNEKPLHVIFIKREWGDILYYLSLTVTKREWADILCIMSLTVYDSKTQC